MLTFEPEGGATNPHCVIGIRTPGTAASALALDSRFRGNDWEMSTEPRGTTPEARATAAEVRMIEATRQGRTTLDPIGLRGPSDQLAALLAQSTKVTGVTAAVVVGRDGLLLHSEHKAGAADLDPEAIGALACSVIPPAEDMIAEGGPSRLLEVILEHEDGLILIKPLRDFAVLSLAANADAKLDRLRLTIRLMGAQVAEALTAN